MRFARLAAALSLVALGSFTALGAACSSSSSDSASCVDLCQAAQDKSCTIVMGDCAKNCGSLDKVSSEGTCNTQNDAYFSCLADGDVCTGSDRCSGEQGALEQCAIQYCAAHSSDTDCQTVESAFQ